MSDTEKKSQETEPHQDAKPNVIDTDPSAAGHSKPSSVSDDSDDVVAKSKHSVSFITYQVCLLPLA